MTAVPPHSAVRQQYEMLPYPPVNPQDERHRLMHTWLEQLPMLNHYCFGGRQSFRDGFRALVAGGGTGSATIYLAEQLKHTDARVVHLDFSAASMDIAKARAQIRGLTNIDWVLDSILNIPQLALQPFDYINCSGVLHHLPDPDAGLGALLSVLKDDGALGLMLYGQIGRTGIYQMQELMRAVNRGETGIPGELDNAKQLLAMLPAGNWFKRCEDLWRADMASDADLYDIALHSQDRAYTVEQLYAWLADGHGLSLAFSAVHKGRSAYLPGLLLGRQHPPPPVLAKMTGQSQRAQYAMAELLSGNIMTHVFYATRSPQACAAYGDAALVPFFCNEPLNGPQVAAIFNQNGGEPFWLDHKHVGVTTVVHPGRHAAQVFQYLDGQRSFQQIFDLVRAEPASRAHGLSNQQLFDDFRSSYDILNAMERLLLRHPHAQS
jgi:ubiquinone/menaquinone biosynthesis C-methylase UbiE